MQKIATLNSLPDDLIRMIAFLLDLRSRHAFRGVNRIVRYALRRTVVEQYFRTKVEELSTFVPTDELNFLSTYENVYAIIVHTTERRTELLGTFHFSKSLSELALKTPRLLSEMMKKLNVTSLFDQVYQNYPELHVHVINNALLLSKLNETRHNWASLYIDYLKYHYPYFFNEILESEGMIHTIIHHAVTNSPGIESLQDCILHRYYEYPEIYSIANSTNFNDKNELSHLFKILQQSKVDDVWPKRYQGSDLNLENLELIKQMQIDGIIPPVIRSVQRLHVTQDLPLRRTTPLIQAPTKATRPLPPPPPKIKLAAEGALPRAEKPSPPPPPNLTPLAEGAISETTRPLQSLFLGKKTPTKGINSKSTRSLQLPLTEPTLSTEHTKPNPVSVMTAPENTHQAITLKTTQQHRFLGASCDNPLHKAVMKRNVPAVEKFSRNPALHVPNRQGSYPIHLAVITGDEKILRIVASNSPCPEVRDGEGLTSVALARREMKPKIAEILVSVSQETAVNLQSGVRENIPQFV